MNTNDCDALVTGGTGFVGRWLLSALTRRGRRVLAVVRGADRRAAELARFVDAHGGDASRLVVIEGDLETASAEGARPASGKTPGLGLPATDLGAIRDVFHVAARFAFALDPEEAHRANVEGTIHVAELALALPRLRRFVAFGGYRMTRPPAWLTAATYPFDPETRARLRREHGAYVASKREAHAALLALSRTRGLPLTTIHPSTVIGDARTGETLQTTGLGDLVERLWCGRLPALAGDASTFLPVVTVDYLAEVAATAPERDETLGQDLVVLDPSTPNLLALVARIAAHLGVAAPKRSLPVGLVRALPAALTGLSTESLAFLVADRYDTRAAEAHADAMGIARPPLDESVARWCDHLVSTRFLAEPTAPAGRFSGSGARRFSTGDPAAAQVIYLHGIPWNGASFRAVADRVGGRHAILDHPGLGRSQAQGDHALDADLDDAALLATRAPITIVGHSLGAATAVAFAHAHPERVRALVLVAPAFLQAPPPRALRLWPLVARRLRRATPAALAARLAPGADPSDPAFASAAYDLRRRGVAGSTARVLARASHPARRAEVLRCFTDLRVPVLIVHGSREPLCAPVGQASVVTIAGGDHVPHLTHADEVATAIRGFLAAVGSLEVEASQRVGQNLPLSKNPPPPGPP